jgi:hypothetical protein
MYKFIVSVILEVFLGLSSTQPLQLDNTTLDKEQLVLVLMDSQFLHNVAMKNQGYLSYPVPNCPMLSATQTKGEMSPPEKWRSLETDSL